MSNPVQEIFADDELCKYELLQVREKFGDKRTTRKEYKHLLNSCLLALMYCSEKMRAIAEATYEEAIRRQVYFDLHLWPMVDADGNDQLLSKLSVF